MRITAPISTALLWLAACSPPPPEPPPSFLLLSVDTLRADHLSCYGHSRDTSPVLDRLAGEGLVYTDCLAPASWTLPSHFALLSGQHPYEAGVTRHESSIAPEVPMLAEALSAAGWQTAALVDSRESGYVGAERGFGRGFDLYRHAPFGEEQDYEYDMAVTADEAVEWLEGRDSERPFFLFLHTKAVHASKLSRQRADPRRLPYSKPEPYASRFLSEAGREIVWSDPELGEGIHWLRGVNERLAAGQLEPEEIDEERREALMALYDAGIFYMDEHFGRVLEALDRLGLDENTVVIVTADHGEAFLEHRLFLHVEVYRQLLRVPLVLRLPGLEGGRRLDQPVTLADVPATILSLAGVEAPAAATGRPLPLRASQGLDPRVRFAFYGQHAENQDRLYEGFSLRVGHWSLVHHQFASSPEFESELYDLREDPDELAPLTDRLDVTTRLVEELWSRRDRMGAGPEIELDAGTLEHLRELGYL